MGEKVGAGACLCGAVRFEGTGPLDRVAHFHGTICQRAHGAAFVTWAALPSRGEVELEPPDMARWLLQKHVMYVFDALIANLDRNQGNVLIDRDWRLWFIDHTRAFVQTGDLLDRKKITRCSRDLWRALRELDEAALRQRLEPFLTKGEIEALLKRRVQLVAHIQKLIAANGEAAVLFELVEGAAAG